MSELADQLGEDLKAAMRARDTLALNTLRAVKTAIRNAAIEKGGAQGELDADESVAVVRKQIKQRHDSIEQFAKAGRNELADRERAEIALLERYLPAALSGEEVAAIVDAAISETGATSRADMGRVMQIVRERAAGRAEGKVLSQAVMAKLTTSP